MLSLSFYASPEPEPTSFAGTSFFDASSIILSIAVILAICSVIFSKRLPSLPPSAPWNWRCTLRMSVRISSAPI